MHNYNNYTISNDNMNKYNTYTNSNDFIHKYNNQTVTNDNTLSNTNDKFNDFRASPMKNSVP